MKFLCRTNVSETVGYARYEKRNSEEGGYHRAIETVRPMTRKQIRLYATHQWTVLVKTFQDKSSTDRHKVN